MNIYPQKQSLTVRAAAWYLKDFPIMRGKGWMNRLFGKFLQVRVFDGIKLRLINPLEYHQKILLFQEKEYEQQMINMLGHVLKPGMVFFDVGANMGYHTLLASRLVGTKGQVHAFEPAPTQFHHLKLNVQINNARNIVMNNCAVADSIGEKELFLSEGWNQGIHSLGKLPGREKSCRVPCISIDDYIERNSIKQIDVMKVDVEGAELFVFKGAERTLASHPPPLLIFEAGEEFTQALGHSTCDVKRLIEGYDYTLYRIEDALQPVRISSSTIEEYANLVAIHSRAEDRYYKALQTACNLGAVNRA